ncbi:hypothetical protein Bca4012_024161 [Brassica carinata]
MLNASIVMYHQFHGLVCDLAARHSAIESLLLLGQLQISSLIINDAVHPLSSPSLSIHMHPSIRPTNIARDQMFSLCSSFVTPHAYASYLIINMSLVSSLMRLALSER